MFFFFKNCVCVSGEWHGAVCVRLALLMCVCETSTYDVGVCVCLCVTSTVDIIHSNFKSSNCLESSVAIGYEQNIFFSKYTQK